MDGDLRFVVLGLGALAARIGVCLYLCGVSQSKNAAAAVTRAIVDLCVAVLAFWAVGNAVLNGRLGFILGRHNSFDATAFFIACIVPIATGAALGGALERIKMLPPAVLSALLAGVVVPLGMRFAWHGRLHAIGFLDNAGGCFLHVTGGLCALAAAVAAGSRQGKYNHDGSVNAIPGHNLPLAAAGVLTLAIGLLAQIVGCQAVRNSPMMIISAAQALLAAAAGGMAGLSLGRARAASTDFHYLSIGLLGGLISIAAGAGHFSPLMSVVTGAIGGLLAAWSSAWLDLDLRIDDPANSFSIHAVAGAWGVMVASILYFPPFLLVQALGLVVIGGMALAASVGVYLAFRLTTGLRQQAADELDGADLAELDVNAYPDFQQDMIKSHHLRQM